MKQQGKQNSEGDCGGKSTSSYVRNKKTFHGKNLYLKELGSTGLCKTLVKHGKLNLPNLLPSILLFQVIH
jgi:hypothetical protein